MNTSNQVGIPKKKDLGHGAVKSRYSAFPPSKRQRRQPPGGVGVSEARPPSEVWPMRREEGAELQPIGIGGERGSVNTAMGST